MKVIKGLLFIFLFVSLSFGQTPDSVTITIPVTITLPYTTLYNDSTIINYKDSVIYVYKDSTRIKDSINVVKTGLDTALYNLYSNYVVASLGEFFPPGTTVDKTGITYYFLHKDSGKVQYEINPGYNPPDSLMQVELKFYYKKPEIRKLKPIAAIASKTPEANHTPDKTIDGLNYRDPESRWTASPLPQWIYYDLGNIKFITKMNISFYNFQKGRIYKFNLYISNDANTWKKIISDRLSSNLEWTNISGINSSGRFMKIEMIWCNNTSWGTISEVEIFGK